MSGDWASHIAILGAAAHVCVTLIVVMRAVMRRSTSNTVVLWLLFVAAMPLIGVLIYITVAERRLEAMDRNTLLTPERRTQLNRPAGVAEPDDDLARIAMRFASAESSTGNGFRFFSEPGGIFGGIVSDISQARRSVYLETYIWCAGGRMDRVLDALLAAARRGVACHVIVDAIGSAAWCRSAEFERFRAGGVTVIEAMPLRRWRTSFARSDMRLHRKIVAVDDRAAWTGSMNMADPEIFKAGSRAAPWVDAMVRVEGPAAAHLANVVRRDIAQEMNGEPDTLCQPGPGSGAAAFHVVRSGPDDRMDELLHMLLAIVHGARSRLIVATPYLVPDDAILQALRGAAYRGVRIDILVPERIDTLLVRHASHSHYDGLLNIGARIHRYGRGLMHIKAMVADGRLAMFGSANLDLRSLWLNDEVSLFCSGPEFGASLTALLQSYIDASRELNIEQWNDRGFGVRMLENTLRLASPVL